MPNADIIKCSALSALEHISVYPIRMDSYEDYATNKCHVYYHGNRLDVKGSLCCTLRSIYIISWLNFGVYFTMVRDAVVKIINLHKKYA